MSAPVVILVLAVVCCVLTFILWLGRYQPKPAAIEPAPPLVEIPPAVPLHLAEKYSQAVLGEVPLLLPAEWQALRPILVEYAPSVMVMIVDQAHVDGTEDIEPLVVEYDNPKIVWYEAALDRLRSPRGTDFPTQGRN